MQNKHLSGSEVDKKSMEQFLWKMHAEGVEFFVDGESVFVGEAVQRAVMEENCFMADYVVDEIGDIKEVHFDTVDPQSL